MQARLLLEDGTLFTGKAFGSTGNSVGEVVFNTGVAGYQDVLTDPAYSGQIVMMTYPLIGNYGIARDDFESFRPFVQGLIVRDYEEVPSNWRAKFSIDTFMKESGIIGMYGIDTRMLTRIIRDRGIQRGIMTTSDLSVEELMAQLNSTPVKTDYVAEASTKNVYRLPGSKERVVLVDYGSKSQMIRDLTVRGCDVVVVPHDTTAEQIRRFDPDGVLLSDGPGDPKHLTYAVETIRELLGEVPLFGISLGHQLLALACGADTEKMKFGHRGGNHPVKDLVSGRCYITSQNHGHVVAEQSLAGTDLTITHLHNNDKTVAGLKHNVHPAFSVQHHPEEMAGPWESHYLFDDFITMIHSFKEQNPTEPSQAAFIAARGASASQQKGDLVHAKK